MLASHPRSRSVLDVAIVLWTALWIAFGILTAHEVGSLADLGNAAGRLGRAVTNVGEAVNGIPLIGGQVGGPVVQAGHQAQVTAAAARDGAHRLGLLLGLAIAAVPTLPLLLLYVPARLADERERRAIREAMAASGGAGAVDELLAHRALTRVPYAELQRISPDPVGDLRAGRHTALADAELARLDVRRPTA